MEFEKEYLTDIVKGKTRGDFIPFSAGKWNKSDKYLKQVVGRLKDSVSIYLDADFDHYGSGFSSYVHVYLSKKDKSDQQIEINGDERTENTHGLMVYLCRMAPFAVYAEGFWTKTFKADRCVSGSSHFIEPEQVGTIPSASWKQELIEISNVLNEFGIAFFKGEELNKKVGFEISVPTILSDPPFKVFDCLFYWAD